MRKNLLKIMVVILAVTISNNLDAQVLKNIGKGIVKEVKKEVDKELDKATERSSSEAASSTQTSTTNTTKSVSSTPNSGSTTDVKLDGTKIYVSAARGSVRGAGTKDSPYRDLQKAVEQVAEGSVICVAEGNYLGRLDAGYIEITKYLKLVGGYSDDFGTRDPLKYITKIQPTQAQNGTNGSRGLITLEVKGKRNAEILIDGFILDYGMQNNYHKADPTDPRNGCCEGCETGRITPGGEPNGLSHQIMKGHVEGKLIVRNCVFANGPYFGMQMTNSGGDWEVYNNVFVSNVYAACCVNGAGSGPGKPIVASIDFHHNTVLFSWCRSKTMEDMGYGFRYMTGIHANVYNNIFGCSNLGALDRGYIDSDKAKEAERKTSAYNNMFFMNAADLVLPSPGGGKWTLVPASRFDEVEQLTKYEGNFEAKKGSNIMNVIDKAYLKGFASLKVVSSSSFDPNSAANTYRQAHGMNMQGTETVRVSMFGNRYSIDKTYVLFGAEAGYGAQKIK